MERVTHGVRVTAQEVLVACRACQSQVLLPPPVAAHWMTAHRAPFVAAFKVTFDGGPTRWWRR